MRYFQINDLYNILLNNSIESAVEKVKAESNSIEENLNLLYQVYEIYTLYQDQIAAGVPFMRLYIDHRSGGVNKSVQLPPVPDTLKRFQNLSRALFRFVIEGLPIESRTAAEVKLAICETNSCGFFDGSVCRHINCGCFSKIKTFFASEKCPIGKW